MSLNGCAMPETHLVYVNRTVLPIGFESRTKNFTSIALHGLLRTIIDGNGTCDAFICSILWIYSFIIRSMSLCGFSMELIMFEHIFH